MVGVGERTNDAGADHLARFLFDHTPVERVVKVIIPAKREFMHLDTVLTFVDRRRDLTLPYLWDRPAGLRRGRGGGRAASAPRSASPTTGRPRERMARGLAGRGGDAATARGESFDDTMAALADAGAHRPGRRRSTWRAALDQYPRPEEHVVEALREQWNDGANMFALKPGQVMSYGRNDRTFRALEEDGVEVVAFRRRRARARPRRRPLHDDAAAARPDLRPTSQVPSPRRAPGALAFSVW